MLGWIESTGCAEGKEKEEITEKSKNTRVFGLAVRKLNLGPLEEEADDSGIDC